MATRKANRSAGVDLAEARVASKIARLTITNSCFAGLEIALKKRKTILGKSLACDICLDDSLVSDEHAAILRTDVGFQIEDLNSRNGLTLNGKEVHQKKLNNGDTIEIGNFRLRFSYSR
jgi:pSer/pThr/pTyr-binding forkhead associated (FHA) protein